MAQSTPMYYEGQEFVSDDPSKPTLVYRKGKFIDKSTDLRGMSDLLSPQEQAALNDAREASSNAISVLDTLTGFQNINEGRGVKRQPTGGIVDSTVNFLTQWIDPELQELQAKTAVIAPSKRQPGSGTTSDKDLALYLKGSPSIYKEEAANNGIIEDGRREAVRRQQRATFLDNYARQYGTLNGAEEAFRKVVGAGTQASPYSPSEATDRASMPRGAFYYDAQGNLRRNDNGARGNPIIIPAKPGRPRPAAAPAPAAPSGVSVSNWS